MTNDRFRDMIEKRLDDEGYIAESWREGDDGLEAVVGRFEATSDTGTMGSIFAGERGELTACVVGAQQYNNEHVMFSFTADDTEGGDEITDLSVLEPTDE